MSKKHPAPADPGCPCGSGRAYAACCGPCHDGTSPAPSAEALMRSRYSAFVLGNATYLLHSWHASTRPATLDLKDDPTRWLGLKILAHSGGGPDEREGTVEFVARYKAGGKAGRLHEVSRFVREEGQWYYLDGDIR